LVIGDVGPGSEVSGNATRDLAVWPNGKFLEWAWPDLSVVSARTYLPITIKKTERILAGRSKAQMFEGIKIAFDKKELPPLESGAMCYMMSEQSYLSDHDGHWHPHLMFFVPLKDSSAMGRKLAGFPNFRIRGHRGQTNRLPGSGPQVVRRHARSHQRSLTIRHACMTALSRSVLRGLSLGPINAARQMGNGTNLIT